MCLNLKTFFNLFPLSCFSFDLEPNFNVKTFFQYGFYNNNSVFFNSLHEFDHKVNFAKNMSKWFDVGKKMKLPNIRICNGYDQLMECGC